ncbi:unnamed protein product [Prorocentrum cordatum]|uniref:Subtilisin n=1 Tax=Prorocentrum cordatum TaxID=2364126 RepID=A0ABN9T868_9DINO|nr:unnamed protein product [Polarella glacialis]
MTLDCVSPVLEELGVCPALVLGSLHGIVPVRVACADSQSDAGTYSQAGSRATYQFNSTFALTHSTPGYQSVANSIFQYDICAGHQSDAGDDAQYDAFAGSQSNGSAALKPDVCADPLSDGCTIPSPTHALSPTKCEYTYDHISNEAFPRSELQQRTLLPMPPLALQRWRAGSAPAARPRAPRAGALCWRRCSSARRRRRGSRGSRGRACSSWGSCCWPRAPRGCGASRGSPGVSPRTSSRWPPGSPRESAELASPAPSPEGRPGEHGLSMKETRP